MHIVRNVFVAVAALALAGLVTTSLAAGGQTAARSADPHAMPMPARGTTMGPSTMTREQKIENAMSAAPAAISKNATILDWPAKQGDAPTVLRKGTNGWTCLADMPDSEGNDPMCLDGPWLKWVEAYMSKTPPMVGSVGIGYMIAPGGAKGSNTDPYATKAAPDNQWAHHPPHMMIVVPDLKSLEGIPTDPFNGGPYVMYKGTPYAHIMAPTAPGMTHGH